MSAAVRSTSASRWKADPQICAIQLGNRRPRSISVPDITRPIVKDGNEGKSGSWTTMSLQTGLMLSLSTLWWAPVNAGLGFG